MNKLKKKPLNSKHKGLFNIISKLTVVAAIVACFASIIVTKSTHSEMQKELDSINNKAEEIEAENVELQRILENDDMDAYMEKLAIEKMNYAYPDERRYYDKSKN